MSGPVVDMSVARAALREAPYHAGRLRYRPRHHPDRGRSVESEEAELHVCWKRKNDGADDDRHEDAVLIFLVAPRCGEL
mgnify:CR=1 FL=1